MIKIGKWAQIMIIVLLFLACTGLGWQLGRPTIEEPKIIHQPAAQLTELDLVKPICKPSYIEKHGDLLCRELTCLQFSRGIDSQTSGQQCESISNIANSIAVMQACTNDDTTAQQQCIDLFWRRK